MRTVILALFLLTASAKAVQTSSGVYDFSVPGGAEGVAWSYVGTVNGASGVYLGNGWVLTAAHVGAGNFVLGGTTYTLVAGSARNFINEHDSSVADLSLYQIAGAPVMPSITFANGVSFGDQVLMVGYGNGGAGDKKTWGYNYVAIDDAGFVPTQSYYTSSFVTFDYAFGVPGDSGGAAFVYNNSLAQWELAGVMIGYNLTGIYNAFADIDHYAAKINDITAIPEPAAWLLILPALLAVSFVRRRRGRGQPITIYKA